MTEQLRGPWLATVSGARLLLIGASCATGVLAPTRATLATTAPVGAAPVWWVLAAAVVAVHLWHVFGAQRERHDHRASFALLAALVFLPMLWAPAAWGISQVFFVASAALLFRGTVRGVLVLTPVAATALGALLDARVVDAVEVVVVFPVLAGCLVGVVHLVRAVRRLDRARADLATRAAARERLRVSRDLHDLLGQSLSAVSLKGDLAAALLPDDPGAARAEIDALGELARATLRAMGAITKGEHTLSLRTELDSAAALLDAAGIEVRCAVDLPTLDPDVDNVFASVIREGATNVLRHSDARVCSIVAGRGGGVCYLEIVNDGARRESAAGNGLTGLEQRARGVSGTVSARLGTAGRFHLRVEIPWGTT
ncbi:sensor histidine kinase [Nocardia sp. NPDC127579]|uniref:sensor histidine kinase n=1 Tax=Nocardia sp. NPDC127579 TaxID=3345402 RepID=UPI00363ED767